MTDLIGVLSGAALVLGFLNLVILVGLGSIAMKTQASNLRAITQTQEGMNQATAKTAETMMRMAQDIQRLREDLAKVQNYSRIPNNDLPGVPRR